MISASQLIKKSAFAACILAALALTAGAGTATAGQNDGLKASTPATAPEAKKKVKYGKNQILELGAIDFSPVGTGADYKYCTYGGVCITAGVEYFNAGLRLPVGAKIIKIIVYLNPNGTNISVSVDRYSPMGQMYETIGHTTSTAGTQVEALTMVVKKVVEKGWNYRIDDLQLALGGADLYGATVIYKLPRTK